MLAPPIPLLLGVATVTFAAAVAAAPRFARLVDEDAALGWSAPLVAATLAAWACVGAPEPWLLPNGQAAFQMSWSAARVRSMLAGMTRGQLALIGFSFGVDVLFMALYPVALATLSLRFGRTSPAARVSAQTRGCGPDPGPGLAGLTCALEQYAVAASFAGGLLDFVEGVVFMRVIANPDAFDDDLVPFGTLCAVTKFALLAFPIGFIAQHALSKSSAPGATEGGKPHVQ